MPQDLAKRPGCHPQLTSWELSALLIWSSMSGTTCRGPLREDRDCLQGRQMSEAGSRQPGPAPPSLAARSPAGPVPAALRLGWSQQTWAEYQLSPFLTPLPLLLRASAFSPNKWETTSISRAAVRTQ